MSLIHLDKEDFNKLIEKKTLVDFFATWCGPCKMLGPILEEASKETDVNFVKVDVDQFNDLAISYGVMSIPTIILFENGKEVKRQVGFISKEDLLEFIK